jgi:pyridoxal phosphate enzyme (YggS family)
VAALLEFSAARREKPVKIGGVLSAPTLLAERYKQVQDRVARAAERCRRDPAGILLLAVTKKFPAEIVREAYELGMREFGENYVQEFELKQPLLKDLPEARFHLIGHLQSNKARKAAELFHTIQTIDSIKLAERLDAMEIKLDAMIEVKLSDEESKHGAAPEEVADIVAALKASKNLRLRGLMTIPPWSEDPEAPRPYFKRLRELNERFELPELSMGMSNDIETAIEEGSTIVRVGTALFGPRGKQS